MSVNYTHFKVNNGNCSIIEGDNFIQIIDLKGSEDESSYELLKPHFRKKNGVNTIDVLTITHGDQDHCSGFKKFAEEMGKGSLVIGSIWHQGFDRTKDENYMKNPSQDYIALNDEIKRREKIKTPQFGDYVLQPKAMHTEVNLYNGITNKPSDLYVNVLSPFDGDNEDSVYDVNDLSMILNFDYKGLKTLYAGDSTSKYWQDKVFPELLNKSAYSYWAEADVLIVAHHGSATFFGTDRQSVRDADPKPENYDALDKIDANDFVISAGSKFPLSGDSSRDNPPHYAAWKWYHKWVRDNRSVSEDDKHPSLFKYTSEGNKRWEYDINLKTWKFKDNWKRNPEDLRTALTGAPSVWGGLKNI